MNLSAAIAAELPRLRRVAESLMTDTGVMRRPTGRSTQNANGEEDVVYADVFTSICKVQADTGKDVVARTVIVGGVERAVLSGGLHLPIGSAATERGWVFEVTAVGTLSDVRLLGNKYWVDNDPVKSAATARRLDVVEV